MEMQSYQRRAWAEVNIDHLFHNFTVVRQAAAGAKLCCVVKANAYGHGALMLSRMYERLGADFLAVASIEEALQLRHAGIRLPILNLGYCPPDCAEMLARFNVSQCVFSKDYADALSKNARAADVSVKIHIKIDTGMGRLGFDGKRGNMDEIKSVYCLSSLFFEGIFTHFSVADEGEAGEEYTHRQLSDFLCITEHLAAHGISVGIRHAAGSAAIFAYPEAHLDMVRSGIALYGLLPVAGLRPALVLKTVVSQRKRVKAGDSISYGRAFIAPREMKIATLPIGYADGLPRACFERGVALALHGCRAPIVGRVCMDQCMIDVSDIEGADAGDTVIVYAAEGENSVSEIARKNGTICYEILCAIGERVPRIYIRNGKPVAFTDNIARGTA